MKYACSRSRCCGYVVDGTQVKYHAQLYALKTTVTRLITYITAVAKCVVVAGTGNYNTPAKSYITHMYIYHRLSPVGGEKYLNLRVPPRKPHTGDTIGYDAVARDIVVYKYC